MRILMLIDSMENGGAQTHLLSLASGLVDLGHRVCVVSSGGALVPELVRHGVFHIRMPINSKMRAPFLIKRVCRLVKLYGFEIIHSHARVPSLVASAVAFRTGVCFVSTVHARFSLSLFRRALSRWGRASIAVSEDLGRYLTESYGVPPEQVTVIPNGVDSSRFYPARRESSGALRIVFLSRLDTECSFGAFLLCDIARALFEKLGRVEIVIGGGGGALERVRARAREVNSELGFECVKAVGQVRDVPELLRSADIFVGVSRAAIEASLCGASVIICGDEGFLGALREDNFARGLTSNFCARGLAPATARSLYREIEKLLSQNREERLESAMAVRSRMLDVCDLGRSVVQTEAFYRRALLGRKEVVLCGYYGFGNMGDDALLRAAIARASREFSGARIVAITKNGARDGARFGIECIARRDVYAVLSAIKGAHYFIFGGGTLLQDTTSRRSLLYYAALLDFAKRHGARCYLWGNGIGELRSRGSADIVRRALSLCDRIGLRDERSFLLARALLGEGARLELERDLAQAQSDLFAVSEERARRVLKGVSRARFVIVALKGKRCPPELEALMRRASQAGTVLVFVPMFPAQDMKISRRYCKKYGGVLKIGLDFADLIALARGSAGVYSMRLHALVAAKIADVSFCGFGDVKVTDFR